MHPRRASLLTRWWNALFPPLLSSCHSFPLSSCSNLIYLPPESIIFVVCATLRESTFASQRCLTRCVLKASIHALNEAHCFSFCLKWDSFMIFHLVCMHVCVVLLLFNGLGLLADHCVLSCTQSSSVWFLPSLSDLSYLPLTVCAMICVHCRVIYYVSGPMCVCEEESQSFDLLAKCMLMPVKCSIAGLLKAFTPFNLHYLPHIWDTMKLEAVLKSMKLSVQCVLKRPINMML